jgi:uncharacterized protein (DUF1015 family)
MAEVSPFCGIRYNREIVKDIAAVICPPYDIITPQQQKLYYERSDYNIIRLEHPLQDYPGYSKYTRAAITFQEWLKQGVLQPDNYPAFYLHDQYFTYMGERKRRRGLVTRVRLEPWGKSIYPHEETFPKAKSDRLQLMRACQANFSPLLCLYSDPGQEVAQILLEASQDSPIIELDDSGESHIVWAITKSKFQQQISRSLLTQPLYMADGHHRYETALNYQQERLQASCDSNEASSAAFNYVMMTLVEFSDPGLVVFPIHRLVRGIAPSTLLRLRKQLEDFFILESIPLTEDLISSLECKLPGNAMLGVLGLEPQVLITLSPRPAIEDMMPETRSQAYKTFDTSLVYHLILDRMLGLASDSENLAYTVDVNEACHMINESGYQLAFLLNPPNLATIKAIVDAKDKMPRKSSYFYPKLPTGLIINPLSEWANLRGRDYSFTALIV